MKKRFVTIMALGALIFSGAMAAEGPTSGTDRGTMTRTAGLTQVGADNIQINDSIFSAVNPVVVDTPDNEMYAVYVNTTDHRLEVARSNDDGKNWSFVRWFTYNESDHPSAIYAKDEASGTGYLVVSFEGNINTTSAIPTIFKYNIKNDTYEFFTFPEATMETGDEVIPVLATSYMEGNTAPYVYIAYSALDTGKPATFFSRSADYGLTWDTAKAIGAADSGVKMQPDLAFDSSVGQIYAVFNKKNGIEATQVYLATSQNGGSTWQPPVAITSLSTQPSHPSVAVGYGKAAVAFGVTEQTTSGDILYTYSNDGGASWSATAYLTNTASDERSVDLAASHLSNGYMHAVYSDLTEGHIEYRRIMISNLGGTWSAPKRVEGVDGQASTTYTKPSIGLKIDGGRLTEPCFTWTDERNTKYAAYYSETVMTEQLTTILYLLN